MVLDARRSAALRVTAGAMLYAALLLYSSARLQGPSPTIISMLAAVIYGVVLPVAAVASLPALILLGSQPIMLVSGILVGAAVSLIMSGVTMPRAKQSARLREASAAMAGASLSLGIVSWLGGFPKPSISLCLLGIAVSLTITILAVRGEKACFILGMASGLSWYGLPFIAAAASMWTARPKPYSRGILIGRLIACAHRCGKGLRGKSSLCWRPVAPSPLRIDPFSYRNPHILVVGMSGAGKTTLAKKLIVGLASRNTGVLVLDFHGEYGDLGSLGYDVVEASQFPLNLLDLEGSSPREKASEIADMVQTVFGLGSLQRVALEQLIEESYESKGIYQHDPATWSREPPTLLNVALVLRQHLAESPTLAERSRLAGIAMYLDLLSRTFYQQTASPFNNMLGKRLVIRLDSIPGEHVKTLYVETLLRRLAITMYKGGLPGPQVVLVEEAHRLSSRNRRRRSTLARLLVESRKYRLGFIIVSQQPLDLDEAILANTWLKFALSIQEPRNTEYIARMMGVHDRSLHSVLKSLERGEALVEAGGAICRARISTP